ncbi:hypothetical protein L211DRAFT_607011 [Terfezia boudieri ATCC MYA-4762]|uniref:Uncharacterized protein n=1 Tax=Terfezia boudieri ATCC MYA-4762 TaxID=1051890 RepID=A0A3N4LW16_9PEZI|nr:hypothetical protein L211DRAFT_607011 [Terfezia boudieri ATCC MYA-4762]
MHDHSSHPHPLLAQLSLSVSPFISLPSAVTLPYNYQTLPHALPPSSTAPPPPPPGSQESPPVGYITSPSGLFTTTPEAIIASCQSLILHLADEKRAAEEKIREWERSIEERELMEKRRVAPGYLDTGVTMLTPVKVEGKTEEVRNQEKNDASGGGASAGGGREGEELDRMFGRMGMGL